MAWLLKLWEKAPPPAKAARLREATSAKLIRRFDATHVLAVLRQPAVTPVAGTVDAATSHIATLIPRIRLLNRQIKDAHERLDAG